VTGRPDADRDAVRRYRKGDWILELRAFVDRNRPARVVAIRTRAEDERWWSDERMRRLTSKKD